MSMLDAFFNKGFKAAKCKTLLKLTIPRIKLLRNRREIQIKQMRRDIAKLLETGQEATARIRVEHIIREENMMAAQEIIELFCELIAVRLPIIETQRECPLDLKEAISSVCFAAPRCADLPELQQVQMLFAGKYGREFITAAAELMPDCGVNRQIIELLSVRAPQPDVKLKLLKEIAEEHELDWDPAASETEYFKQPEDLLNVSTQFVNQSKVPLPKEKYEETIHSSTVEEAHEKSDSDSEWDSLGFPEVPKGLRPPSGSSGLEAPPAPPQAPVKSEFDHEPMKPSVGSSGLETQPPPQAPLASEFDHEQMKRSGGEEDFSNDIGMEHKVSASEQFVASPEGSPNASVNERDGKQFSSFISFPHSASASFSVRQTQPPITLSRNKSDLNVDLQDVLAAAHAAAESAERAAASARSAASLATVRITELMNKNHKNVSDRSEQSLQTPNLDASPTGAPKFDHQKSFSDTDGTAYSYNPHPSHNLNLGSGTPSPSPYDKPEMDFDSPSEEKQVHQSDSGHHQPKRLPSMEDDPYFSYPNLFTAPGGNTSGNSVDKF